MTLRESLLLNYSRSFTSQIPMMKIIFRVHREKLTLAWPKTHLDYFIFMGTNNLRLSVLTRLCLFDSALCDFFVLSHHASEFSGWFEHSEKLDHPIGVAICPQ